MRTNSGFTLVEVIVALTLLGVVLLGMTSATTGLARSAATASRSTAALGLIQERIAMVQADPAYAQLEARYGGSEAALDGFPGFTRETSFQVVLDSLPNGRVRDFKRVTVEVAGPGLPAPLSRTVAIARQ
jgi:prepilin-type N-terminal cleavage/methylation domain-containing protein